MTPARKELLTILDHQLDRTLDREALAIVFAAGRMGLAAGDLPPAARKLLPAVRSWRDLLAFIAACEGDE